MNFFIGDHTSLTGFTQVAPRLFLDDGWSNHGDIWYKGYSTECTLSEHIDDIIDGYQPAGKWCVIKDEKVFHPVLRGFPLYEHNDNKTTLKLVEYQPVIYNNSSAPSESILSLEEASRLIGDVLVENVENFYRYNNIKSMDLYVSAGLDTMTCWAVQDQIKTDYNLILHLSGAQKFVPDYRHDVMKSLTDTCWGYGQVTFRKDPVWTNSGFYAETYTYRDIAAVSGFMCFLNNETLDELVTEDDYYHGFITRPRAVNRYNQYKSQINIHTEEELREYLWSTIWYDHQMWHLDNTMVFCPFADIRIPEITLRLSLEDLIKCSVNGNIQRKIIERFAPEKLALVSKYKNTGDVWGNFRKNFKRSMVHENTNFIVL